MATQPRDQLEREISKVRDRFDGEKRDRLLEWASAVDPATVRHEFIDEDGTVKELAPGSVATYLSTLRICITEGFDLLEGDAGEFNDTMARLHDEEGKSKTTLQTYQAGAKSFYTYHDDLPLDRDEIVHFSERSDPKHDERDMFDADDIKALRNACGSTENPPRNRALLELLIFTGQRIRALLTLRVRDVEGQYIYLNDEVDGLKGALSRGRKRPIFGAKKYVRDWLQYHPHSDDPDAWLFVGNQTHSSTAAGEHLATSSARGILERMAKNAGVDKPVNANNFRHYCATVLYRDYDLDRDTIRMLFGHVKGSSTLEEIYSHLFEDDYINKAEAAMGYAERERESPLTPEACPTCGELLEDHWRSCPACNAVFAPDLETASASIAEQRRKILDAGMGGDADIVQGELTAEDIRGLRELVKVVGDPVEYAEQLREVLPSD